MIQKQVFSILFLVFFWVSCAVFITVYDATVLGFTSDVGGEFDLSTNVFVAVMVTICGAALLGSVEVFLLSRLLRKRPFGATLLAKTVVYMMFILVFLSLATLIIYGEEIGKPMFSPEVVSHYVTGYILSPRFGMQILFWGLACMMALFLLQVNEKFGHGVLVNFLLGRYHRPREEKRIFLFMDLHSSTKYAERLGHIDYSRLIQDCYYDLTDIVVRYHAEVYQYVGDEVVLSWEYEKGMKNANCVSAFFAYEDHLHSRAGYYNSRYGFVPRFKAGLNAGVVTAAEVGEIKKDLAYHGDVLNTASRIQDTCNEYGKVLLASQYIREGLGEDSPYSFEFMGNVLLKGKQSCVNIYAVNGV